MVTNQGSSGNDTLSGTGQLDGSDGQGDDSGLICFTSGARIITPNGERPVEDLQAGDKVLTRDNGLREIRWIGRRDLCSAQLVRTPEFQPILIRKGALGDNVPEHDMLVSPNHRMLLRHALAEVFFGEREVLAAAKNLTDVNGVDRAVVGNASYIHLMFDTHEVILANGAWSESFQPGDYSLNAVGQATRHEILSLFPEFATQSGLDKYTSARRSLKAVEARLLIAETL